MAQLPQFILLELPKYLSPSKQEQGASTAAFHDELPESENASQSVESEDPLAPESSERIEFEYLVFEVEKAKTVKGLVHIRACSNSKYWVRESADSELIVAEANEPEEDQSKWSCTLFKPVFLDVDDDSNSDVEDDSNPDVDNDSNPKIKKMHLLHISEYYETPVTLNNQFQLVISHRYAYNLCLRSFPCYSSIFTRLRRQSRRDKGAVQPVVAAGFNIKDEGPIVRLPEYVAFKGCNGRYLVSETDSGGETRLLFKSSDIGKKGVAQRISYSSSNDFKGMQIIDQGTGAYWTTNPRAHKRTRSSSHAHDVIVGTQEMATLFYPIKVRNCIALMCLSTYKFAKGTLIAANKSDVMYLTSDAPTISNDTYLTVEEPVIDREIKNANYDLEHSNIYNESIIEKYIDARSNHTDVAQKGTFQVEYKVSKTMSWNRSTTVNLGIKATLSAGIPYIGTGGVEISYENSSTWAWGEQQTKEKTVIYSQEITIPPRKKVTLKVLLKKAWCDVPFSCKVSDRMTWGELKEYEVTDGLYTGCNVFHLDTKITDEDL